MKIYLAHPISTTGEFDDSKRVAGELRKLGFEVYVASENDSINDKTNEPTPGDIYNGDVYQIVTSDIFVVNVTGGQQDGTISEVGFVSGWNQATKDLGMETITMVGYTSNARLQNPQFHAGIPSAGANHLVLGMIERWGRFEGSESSMINTIKTMKEVSS